MAEEYLLHEDPLSGNCYKIRLTAALMGVPIETRQYDIRRGDTRTDAFLRDVNANGRIPVLQISDDAAETGGAMRFLPESNAACWYIASARDGATALIPGDRYDQADMLRWMFFEQYNHEPNVATLRFWLHYIGEAELSEHQRAQIMPKRIAGAAALALMDDHLSQREWFVGNGVTLADIALFPYTQVAGEGGFDLDQYPAIQRWIARIEALPNFIAMA